ncbi:ubiquitin-like domain-containing CTD phosphatase 1 [Schistocerca americana]|uniref:ubiquitin-like domain-containing CTD phosphatase 1 n=1 Tax=Schistocerca americana TaxID=7009 RepID=UPI001F4F211D|nr:ubiquitin-like domain-containing CTD phosphatase 1 [Schistocerca americana]XP_047111443.1 ubiquitin-like domain-containing CTD phosphatase 1 [Schistocerca piceifrons]XP_049780377.1 ubiquitin-like domain-containing CTD phosphatase 1 [Schistocerca cancellata]XP_049958372.1 ubiquitin-like domain-containing CTD phosphatase 1 [Schistocerca serialis cubense]
MENEVTIVVKWSGKEYSINNLSESDTVQTLKNAIQKETGVRPERQKLLNLKLKGKIPGDDCQIGTLKLKPGFKVMMMGSLEEDIADASVPPEDIPEVINDLDIEEEEVAIENKEVYLAKIDRRIREYKVNILNSPRAGKKLLVLDIDYTLFDHRSTAETGYELMRPFLHEFLTSAYQDYDIVIWSATSMKWIEEKMKLLGVSTHPDYKIAFYLDSLAMISVHTPKYGVVQVKPLGVIWGKFDQYSSKNTIMFDDIRRNFLMNPHNGLKIRPFKQAHLNRDKDRELLRLAKYLQDIAHEEDLSSLEHKHWEKYKRRKHKGVTAKKDESLGSGDSADTS